MKPLVEASEAERQLSKENPWPGLCSFSEHSAAFFKGRDREIEELTRQVRRDVLSVLFGKSGTGKSSLLRAGLFPKFREKGFIPIYIRLRHDEREPALIDQVKENIRQVILDKDYPIRAPQPDPNLSLWEYFHLQDGDWWDKSVRLVTPVLVFDQFEEILTVGRDTQGRIDRGEAFLSELEDLIEGRVPEVIQKRREDDRQWKEYFNKHYDLSKKDFRIVLTLREDFLPELEGLRERLRPIMWNRFRLLPITGEGALDAILKPAPQLVDEATALEIIQRVSISERSQLQASPTLEQVKGRLVEPALLSVLCTELNLRRQKEGSEKIDASLLEGAREEILTNFYERAFEGLEPGVRDFVEDELLTVSGARDRCAIENALNRTGVTEEVLRALIDRRLIRQEIIGRNVWLELSHDILADVARASKRSRDERRRTENAERKAAEAQEIAERRDRQRKLAWIVAAFLIVGVLSVAWIYVDGWVLERESYYKRFAKRYGIMEGVGQLNRRQVARRPVSYRFVTRGRFGQLLRVQAVNGAGRLVPNNGVDTYLNYAWEDTRTERECQWEFVLDHRGLVVYEKARDRFGRLVWGFIYSPPAETANAEGTSAVRTRPQTVRGHYVGPDGYPMPFRGSNAEYVEITYNQDGYEEEVFYRDRSRNPMPGPDRAYGKHRCFNKLGLETEQESLDSRRNRVVDQDGNCGCEDTYDATGNLIRERAFDVAGKTTLVKDGWAVLEQSFDPFGNVTEQAYFNEAGKAVSNKDGYARWTARYDERGNETEVAYFEETNKPVRNKDGYARWTARYDEHGNKTEVAYFDETNKPVRNKDGYARWIIHYDEPNNPIEIAYFDEASKPVRSKDGVARWTARYDERGNRIATAYFDAAGKPVLSEQGYARWTARYDERGKLIEAFYFDQGGKPVLSKDGYARWTAGYDERGNKIAGAYFDAGGNLVRGEEGYARWTAKYDERGNQIEAAYFDQGGKLALSKDGYARWTAKYDERGNQIEATYFDAAGDPVPRKDGYARWTAQYDERGNQIEAFYFDQGGKPVLSKNGYARWTAGYDRRDKQIETNYFDAEGNPMPSKDGYARWTAKYDERGNQTEAAYFDQGGKPVLSKNGYARCTVKYDERGNQIEAAYFDQGDKPLLSETLGYARWTAKYDERGNQIEAAYFDQGDKPVLSENGYERWTAKYDERGNKTEEGYLGEAGKPVRSKDGYARWTAKYDERGNQIEQAYFDEGGNAVRSNDGYARVMNSYDERRHLTDAVFFDEHGEKLYRKALSYDDQGRTRIRELSDLDGKDGFASKKQILDEKGNVVEEAYFDFAGRPTLDNGGISVVRRKYDENGKLIDATFLGRNGEPIHTFAEIHEVASAGEGERSGLHAGDIVLSYDGAEVTNTSQLEAMLSAPGNSLREIRILRTGAELRFKVRPGSLGVTMRQRAKPNKVATVTSEKR